MSAHQDESAGRGGTTSEARPPLDQREAPVLEALEEHRRRHEAGFTPPGHKQGRGADPEVRRILGDAVFLGDVLATGGARRPAHPRPRAGARRAADG